MKNYIVMNQNKRRDANSESEKKLYKDMNNAVYGKTCENLKKRSDIRLLNDPDTIRQAIEKPHLIDYKIFGENLAGVDLRKTRSVINKPFYVGFTVLELSKLLMYQFHYDVIRRRYGLDAQLLFTDTDSFMYQIFTEDVYGDIRRPEMARYFDFSEYPGPDRNPTNALIIGKFKDETKKVPILEFVGLRAKMYSYLTYDSTTRLEKNSHRAKGISRSANNHLRHEDYLAQLNVPAEHRVVNRRIGSKLHQLYSIKTDKVGLSAFDDKRFILDDGIYTLAYGHYTVTGAVVDVDGPEPGDIVEEHGVWGQRDERAHAIVDATPVPARDDQWEDILEGVPEDLEFEEYHGAFDDVPADLN